MNTEFERLSAKYEELGEAAARFKLSRPRTLSPVRRAYLEEWLRSKEQERLAEESKKRDERESEAIAVAKKANRLASEANLIAKSEAASARRAAQYALYACLIATTAAIIAIKDEILKLIL